MGVYSNASLTTLVGQCTTGAPFPTGQCDVTVPANQNYWVAEITSPPPFNKISQLTASSGGTQNYSIAIPSADVGPGELAVAPPEENNNYQRRFANRRNNADFPNTCGISIALLFDNSSSISTPELNQMKAAGVSFSNALQGTPSEVGVYRFASSAATLLGQTATTPAGVTAINSAINGIPQGGGSTNWDDGFQEVANVNADLVIIMTDGNPTISNVGGNGSATTFWDIEEGVASANLAKLGGPKVLALGIGDGVAPLNLQAISGPIQGPTAGNYDYAISDFDQVKNDLVTIATRLCGAQINVTKLLDGQPSSGWTMTPSTPTPGVTFNPNPGITGANGQVAINANPIPDGGANVTITETQKANTAFQSVSCTKNNVPIGTPGSGAITFPVARQDTINCTFNNVTNPGAVKVVKATTPPGGQGPFPITLAGPNYNQQTSLAGDTSQFTFTPVPAGSGYSVNEAVPDGWTLSGVNCGAGVDPTSFTVPSGQTVTCTFTNAVNTGTIKVIKKVDNQQVAGWVVNASNPASPATITPSQVTTVASGTADFGLSKVVAAGSTTTLSEVLQPGHTAGPVTCTATGQDNQTGQTGSVNVTVKPGQTWTCTFDNTSNTANVTVVKKVDGQNAQGWTFGASTVAPTTVTPPSGQTGANGQLPFALSKVLANGSSLTITETLQAGYSFQGATCVKGETNVPINFPQGSLAGTLTVNPGDNITCTFSNATNTGTIKVLKNVDGQQVAGWVVNASNPAAPATITPSQVTTVNPGTADFTLSKVVTAGSTTTLTEVLQAGFAAGGVTCTATGQDNQTGQSGSVNVTVKPGQTWTCTFNNTTNTGTIKVLKKVDGQQVAGWVVNATNPAAPATITPSQVTTVNPGTADFALSKVVTNGSTTTLSEVVQPGFSAGAVTCTATDQTNQTGAAGSVNVTVKPNQTWTCTFDNTTNTGTIKVLKKVDGQQVAGWVVNATNPAAPTTITPSQVTTVNPGTADFALSKVVTAGSTTTLSEVLKDGFTAGGVTCTATNQDNQTGQAGSVNVTVKPGQTWTCTFDNTTNKANVTVVKKVDGQNASGWTFGASTQDPTTVTPPSGQTGANGQLPFALERVLAGGSPLTLTETLQAGYSFQGATCVKGEQQNVPINLNGLVGTLTVNPGDNVTCTFNNVTNTGTIKVLKKVDGQQVAGWVVNATDPGGAATITPSQVTTVNPGTADFALSKVETGGSTTTLSEVLQAGHSAGPVTCTAGDKPDQTGQAGSVDVTVRPNEVWTCTFNNTVNTASVTVVKKVDGTPTQGWTFGATTQAPTTVAPPSGQTDAQGQLGFALSKVLGDGSPLIVTETLQSGFSFQNATCAKGQTNVPINLNGLGGTLTVKPGDAITCTFNNSANPTPPRPPEPGGTSADRSFVTGALPFTGSPAAMLLKIALWLLVIGVACLAFARIRRRRTA